MTLPPAARKLALTAHVVTSVGWLGAVLAFLALTVTALTANQSPTWRAAYPAMDLVTRHAIVPLAVGSLLTGLLSSLGSSWGLLRHYWVTTKLGLVLVATAVLLLQVEPIGRAADAAASSSPTDLRASTYSMAVHATGGLIVLVTTTVLAVYKPRGLTRYGRRRR
jgi:uncharacterized membrane protein